MSKVGDARHLAVENEILAEKAAALGDAAKRVEGALAALRATEAGEERERRIDAAADAVWGFLVQRELMGLRDREAIVAYYQIPLAVLNRAGSIRGSKKGDAQR
ncbi:MAG TPA: DUF6665 family protein [Allosphingosinicella sp.]|nr:DUF6665 family protein [Allosphingosinicella sp.]